MQIFVMPLTVWIFVLSSFLNANAADLIPYHIVSSDQQSVTVDLDRNFAAPKTISIFGQYGWSTATLKKTTEKCEYLCGEGNEEGKE